MTISSNNSCLGGCNDRSPPCLSSPQGTPSETRCLHRDSPSGHTGAISFGVELSPTAARLRLPSNHSPTRSGLYDQDPASPISTPSAAVAALVAVLSDASLERRSLAAGAVGDLAAQSAEARIALINAGALPPLVVMLRSSQCGCACAAAALRNLAARCCPDSASAFSAAGAVPALVSLLREGCAAARGHAAGALSNLCSSTRCKISIVAAGAVPLFAAAIRGDSVECKTLAAAALQNLAAGCDAECCATFV